MHKTIRRLALVLVTVACAFMISGCTVTDFNLNLRSGDGPPKKVKTKKHKKTKGYGMRGPLGIPPGHLPPPGMCKIWFPNTPPGRQSKRSGNCNTLQRQVPQGAWLIRHPSGRGSDTVDVSVYEETRSGSLSLIIRTYNFETGIFISER